MKHLFLNIALLFAFIFNANAQLLNGNFNTMTTGCAGLASAQDWQSNSAQFTNTVLSGVTTNWVDLTPCGSPTYGWGNGAYIEQSRGLIKAVPYSLTFNMAAVHGWNWYKALVTISVINASGVVVATLPAVVNDPSVSPSGSAWNTVTSNVFVVPTSGTYTIRLTGSGQPSALTNASNTAAYPNGIGVVGVDNIVLLDCKSGAVSASAPKLLYDHVTDAGSVGTGVSDNYWYYPGPAYTCNGTLSTTMTITNGYNTTGASANGAISVYLNGSAFQSASINPGDSQTFSVTNGATVRIRKTNIPGVVFNCYSIRFDRECNSIIDGDGRTAPSGTTTDNTAKVFPNPTFGNLTIDLSSITDEQSTITIQDVTGKRIAEQTEIANGLAEFDITSQPAGVYVVSIQTASGQRFVQKLIKQ